MIRHARGERLRRQRSKLWTDFGPPLFLMGWLSSGFSQVLWCFFPKRYMRPSVRRAVVNFFRRRQASLRTFGSWQESGSEMALPARPWPGPPVCRCGKAHRVLMAYCLRALRHLASLSNPMIPTIGKLRTAKCGKAAFGRPMRHSPVIGASPRVPLSPVLLVRNDANRPD